MPLKLGLGLSPVLAADRLPWTPGELSSLRAWYDAELGQPKYGGAGAYVQLDGTSGDYIYTPDTATVSFSNDIEVVMRVKVTDWSAAAIQTLVGKYVTTGNQRSWKIASNTSAQIIITVSTDGTTTNTATITPTVALPDNTWIWLRVRMDLTNGSNSVGTVETAADTGTNDEPSSWTANGTATATALAGIFDSTAPLEIGSFQNGTSERLFGQVGRCIVRSGFAGTTVADFNASGCYGPGYLNQGSLPTDGGGARYVPLRGVSGDYVWTADKPALRITGDIEIVARVRSSSWGGNENFVTRWGAAGAQAFAFQSIASTVRFFVSTDGSNALGAQATVNHGFVAGSTYWVKVTRRASDGRVQFFTAPDQAAEPSSWTQLGADVTLSAGSAIFAAATALELGAQQGGTVTRLAGGVYRAIVRNGIGGTVVADFNAELSTVFGQAADGYGNGWLIADPKHLGNWTLGLPKIYDRSGNGVAPATFGAGSNQPLWLPWKGLSGVYVSPAGNRITCAGSSTDVLTGDVEFVAQLGADLWNNPATQGVLFTCTGIEAYHLTSGAIRFRRLVSTVAKNYDVTLPSIPAGKTMWVRGRFDQDNGASASQFTLDVSHSESPSEPSDWTTIGSATNADTGASDTPSGLSLAGYSASQPFAGIVRRFILRNGFGGALVADFVAASCGQSGHTDPAGLTWGVARATSGRKAVVQSPVAASARSVILHGTDDYIDVPAAAVPALDTFAAASSVTPVVRRWHNPGTVGHAIFATKATSNAVALGTSIRNALTAADPLLVTQVGDGTANDGVNGTGALGTREVASVSVGSVSPIVSIAVSGGAGVTDTNRTTTSTTTTAGAGRIGAYTGGTGAIDMEFEALATRNSETTATEHGQLTAYYRGGL